jgi:hypothetical protein
MSLATSERTELKRGMTANISLEIGTSTIFSAAIFALGAIPGASWEVEFC